jgi:hypothetical protein
VPFAPQQRRLSLYASQPDKQGKTGDTLSFNPFSANMALYSGYNRDDRPATGQAVWTRMHLNATAKLGDNLLATTDHKMTFSAVSEENQKV